MESRRNARFVLKENVLVKPEFKAIDISESGMKLGSARELSKGKELDLLLVLDGEEIRLQGKIMWCNKSNSIFDGDWHAGVQFVNQSISSQIEIRRYISSNDRS